MPAPHPSGASPSPALTRRTALKRGIAGIIACSVAPNFLPARLFGKGAPSNRLSIGLVGNGLIAAHHVGILTGRPEDCRIVAICDVNRSKAEKMRERIEKEPLAEIDYVELVDADTLESVRDVSGRALLALAVRFEGTRLIDNTLLETSGWENG